MVLMSTLLIQTFFISHPNSKDILSKPTCACNACYEIAFPLLDSDLLNTNTNSSTITSHRNFPSRLAVPSVPLGLMRHTVSLSSSLPPRNEDTALQNKLVPSLAVAFPMKSVTARLQQVVAEEQNGGMEGGVGRLKRFCWCLSMVTMEEGGSSGSWKENRERSKMMKRGKGLLLEHWVSYWAEEWCDTSFKYVGFVWGLYCTTWIKFIWSSTSNTPLEHNWNVDHNYSFTKHHWTIWILSDKCDNSTTQKIKVYIINSHRLDEEPMYSMIIWSMQVYFHNSSRPMSIRMISFQI